MARSAKSRERRKERGAEQATVGAVIRELASRRMISWPGADGEAVIAAPRALVLAWDALRDDELDTLARLCRQLRETAAPPSRLPSPALDAYAKRLRSEAAAIGAPAEAVERIEAATRREGRQLTSAEWDAAAAGRSLHSGSRVEVATSPAVAYLRPDRTLDEKDFAMFRRLIDQLTGGAFTRAASEAQVASLAERARQAPPQRARRLGEPGELVLPLSILRSVEKTGQQASDETVYVGLQLGDVALLAMLLWAFQEGTAWGGATLTTDADGPVIRCRSRQHCFPQNSDPDGRVLPVWRDALQRLARHEWVEVTRGAAMAIRPGPRMVAWLSDRGIVTGSAAR